MDATIIIAVVLGLLIGVIIYSIVTKVKLKKGNKLAITVLILKQENLLLRNKLSAIEKTRQERLKRRLHQLKVRTKDIAK